MVGKKKVFKLLKELIFPPRPKINGGIHLPMSRCSLDRIDRKMSCSQTNYKLDEAQAIFSELRSIKKAISTGEKERQDLIQVSAVCLDWFLRSFLYSTDRFSQLMYKPHRMQRNLNVCIVHSFELSFDKHKS